MGQTNICQQKDTVTESKSIVIDVAKPSVKSKMTTFKKIDPVHYSEEDFPDLEEEEDKEVKPVFKTLKFLN